MNRIRRFASSCLLIVGFLVLASAVYTIVDPAGAQGADDNNPFGQPPSRRSSAQMAAVGLGIAGLGFYLRRQLKP
jgi:hypothetical protein